MTPKWPTHETFGQHMSRFETLLGHSQATVGPQASANVGTNPPNGQCISRLAPSHREVRFRNLNRLIKIILRVRSAEAIRRVMPGDE